MSTKESMPYYLDLGDLGETECQVEFDWYVAKRKAEDDYDELTINAVIVEIEGVKIDVVDKLSAEFISDLEEVCWDWVEANEEEF